MDTPTTPDPALAAYRACSSSLLANEPLLATAPRTDTWLLLEHDGPWGKDALAESSLPEPVKAHLNGQLQAIPNSRFQFIRRGRAGAGLAFYVARAHPVQPLLFRFWIDRPEDLLGLDLTATADRADLTLSEERLFLTCTNGRRDACCAREGAPLAAALRGPAGDSAWETTHIGGHRFAGTLVCLPHGVYYGRITPAQAGAVVESYRDNRLLLEHYRGCSAYEAPAQAAEHGLRQELAENRLSALLLEQTTPLGDERWQVTFLARRTGARYAVTVRALLSPYSVYVDSDAAAPKPVKLHQAVDIRAL